jgi:iron complex outermembrane receptor protein
VTKLSKWGSVMRIGLIGATLCLCLVGISHAQSAHASVRKTTNIPAEELGSALQTLAKDYDFQVLYRTEIVANLRTQGAVGTLTPDEALGKVLTGTGLTFRYLDDKTVTIVSASAPSSSLTQTTSSGSSDDASTNREAGKKSSQDFRVAQVDQKVAGPSAVDKGKEEEAAYKKKSAGLEEIVVTGTRIPTEAGREVLPVRRYTREDIETSGQTTIADFLNTLPDVSKISTGSAFDGQNNTFPGQSIVTLHGLPAGTTLTLLNGRRVEGNFAGLFDLNAIPAAALERIEELPVGASAIYGADALGGAINIVTRKGFNGAEITTTVEHYSGDSGSSSGIVWGKSSERASISVIGTYQQTGLLSGSERAQLTTIDFPANGQQFAVTDQCSPGTIYSLNGQNLPGLSSPMAAIPAGISGVPTIAQFASTSGTVNRCNALENYSILNRTQREGALIAGDIKMTESIDVYTEILASHQQIESLSGTSLGVPSSQGFTVGANNPYNPFGVDVGIGFQNPVFPGGFDSSANLIRPLVGARGSLFGDWHYDFSGYLSKDRYLTDQSAVNYSALQSALGASNVATAINPFTTGLPGTSKAVASYASLTPNNYDFVNELINAEGIIQGTLLHIPTGPIFAVVGSDYSIERQKTAYPFLAGSPYEALERKSYAVFGEARAPLIAGRQSAGNEDQLDLSVAARYDHSDDFGGKFTWQGGLLWQATPALSMRASYGLSYKAPELGEISGGSSNFGAFNIGSDPFRGGQQVVAVFLAGQNPALKPETGNSLALTLAYANQAPHGFRASITYYDIKINNYIGIPNPQDIFDYPNLYPGALVRATPTAQDRALGYPGQITQVNDAFYNFGNIQVTGSDADIQYVAATNIGEFRPSLAISNVLKWNSAVRPGAPVASSVSQETYTGVGFAPRWKGTAALNWKRHFISATIAGRYLGPYRDYQDYVPNSNKLGNSWIVDMNVRYDIGQGLVPDRSWLAGTYVAFGAVNLLNRFPPFSYGLYPYDVNESDLVGRKVYVQAGIKW